MDPATKRQMMQMLKSCAEAIGVDVQFQQDADGNVIAITIVGGKGGTGKTTSTVILGAITAALFPHITVFIVSTTQFEDAARKANVSGWRTDQGFVPLLAHVYDVAHNRAPLRELTSFGVPNVFDLPNLYLIPKGANYEMAPEVFDWYRDSNNMKLATSLIKSMSNGQTVIQYFDCDQLLKGTDATHSMVMAMSLSKYVLIPVEAESEHERIDSVFDVMDKNLREAGLPVPEFLGLLVTKVQCGASKARTSSQIILEGGQLPQKDTMLMIEKTVDLVNAKHGRNYKVWVTYDFDATTNSEVKNGTIRMGGRTNVGKSLYETFHNLINSFVTA